MSQYISKDWIRLQIHSKLVSRNALSLNLLFRHPSCSCWRGLLYQESETNSNLSQYQVHRLSRRSLTAYLCCTMHTYSYHSSYFRIIIRSLILYYWQQKGIFQTFSHKNLWVFVLLLVLMTCVIQWKERIRCFLNKLRLLRSPLNIRLRTQGMLSK